jgi:hypothetical protein
MEVVMMSPRRAKVINKYGIKRRGKMSRKTDEILKEWFEKEKELEETVRKHIEFIDEKINEIFLQYGVGDVYFEDLSEEDKKAVEILEKSKEYWARSKLKEVI